MSVSNLSYKKIKSKFIKFIVVVCSIIATVSAVFLIVFNIDSSSVAYSWKIDCGLIISLVSSIVLIPIAMLIDSKVHSKK